MLKFDSHCCVFYTDLRWEVVCFVFFVFHILSICLYFNFYTRLPGTFFCYSNIPWTNSFSASTFYPWGSHDTTLGSSLTNRSTCWPFTSVRSTFTELGSQGATVGSSLTRITTTHKSLAQSCPSLQRSPYRIQNTHNTWYRLCSPRKLAVHQNIVPTSCHTSWAELRSHAWLRLPRNPP